MRSGGIRPRSTTPARIRRGKPKGERLRTHLLSEIASGSLNPGDALVAERDLAKVMQISRSTVRQTLDDMEREGIIHRVQGKGTFVADRQSPELAARSASVAIVVLDVATSYYVSLLSGFEDACTQAGQTAVVCNSGNSIDRQANHLMRLLSQRVFGVVLNASSLAATPTYQVELLQDAGIPVVLLHRPIPEVRAPVLEMPADEIGHRAARMLIDAGHRRVALFDSYRVDLSIRTEASFQKTLNDAGLDLPASNIVYGQNSEWFSKANLDEYDRHLDSILPKLLSQPKPTTAFFAADEYVAEHIYLSAQRLGVRIPDDLSIVSTGGAHRDGVIRKRLTTIAIDEVAAGKKAVELLQEMRAGKRPINDSEQIRLALSCIEGETLKAPAAEPRTKPSTRNA
jgi:GntR family transcriptional regulator of arabinose operon